MKYIVYTFEGLNYSEAANDLLKEHNIEARPIPVPSKVQSGCGFCLRSPFETREEIEKLFDKKDMQDTPSPMEIPDLVPLPCRR